MIATILAALLFIPFVIFLLIVYAACGFDKDGMETANGCIMAVIEGAIILGICVSCIKG